MIVFPCVKRATILHFNIFCNCEWTLIYYIIIKFRSIPWKKGLLKLNECWKQDKKRVIIYFVFVNILKKVKTIKDSISQLEHN